MRIYISSTYEDLREHRTAVARVLRKMGHELVAMEDYTSEAARPQEKCVEDVKNADAYVGIFAWRHGYVPGDGKRGKKRMSITEAEYRAADRPMIFLADPCAPWRPDQMDAIVGEDGGKAITALREELANSHVVSFFSTPESLANAVSTAVYRHEVRVEFKLRKVDPKTLLEGMGAGDPVSISSLRGIDAAVTEAGDRKAVRVDLGTPAKPKWWTTRLYLLASLLDDLADVGVLAFTGDQDRFVGLATPRDVRHRLAPLHPEVGAYEQTLHESTTEVDQSRELRRRFKAWNGEFGPGERELTAYVRAQQLGQWLDTSLIRQYVKMPDEEAQEEPMELIQRIIDWPGSFVALVADRKFSGVVDRRGLAEHIARLFVNDEVRRVRRT